MFILGVGFRPGLVSTDTLQQYAQGRSGDYSNLHPPLYSWLLGVTGSVEPLFWAQLVLIAGGLASLSLTIATPRLRLAWLAGVLALPTLWAIAPTLWKDVLFAAVSVWVVVALAHRRHALATLALMTMACLRHNAVFAVLPFAVLIVLREPSLRSRLVWLLILVVTQLGAPALVERVAHAKDVWPGGQLLIFALAGLQHDGGPPQPGFEDLTSRYEPHGVTPLIGVPEGERYSVEYLAGHRTEVERAVLEAMRQSPLGALRHRWQVTRHLFGLGGEPVCEPFHQGIDDNAWGWRLKSGEHFRSPLNWLRERVRNSPLFRGWSWLVAAGLLVAYSAIRRRWLGTAVSSAAALYSSSLTFTAPTCDFRYHFCVVVLVCCCLGVLLPRRVARHELSISGQFGADRLDGAHGGMWS